MLAVARDPGLARIELAFLGFRMGESATWVAILVYAYALGGARVAAIVALAQLIPAGLAAPFAAYACDRYRRDRVLLAGYLLQAATIGATALALYSNASLVVTVIVASTTLMADTITRPVQAVILPSITHSPADLTAANAVSGLADNLGIFFGPLVAGILLTGGRPADVFAVFAGVSLVSAVLTLRLPVVIEPTGARPGATPGAILRGSFGGFRDIAHERRVLLIVLVLSSGMVVIGALDLLFVAVAIDLLHAGQAWAGFLSAAFGFGGVLGALATVALVGRRRMTPALAGSSALFGLPILLISLMPSTLTAPILFGSSGAGFSITSVAGQTLLQRVAPEWMLARVFGVLESLAMFSLAVGAVASGTIVSTFGIGWGLFAAGILVPLVLLGSWIELGALDRGARQPDAEAVALLKHLPIFAPLSAPSMERILAELSWLDVPAGHIVIREGDPGDRFYVLAEGRVEVSLAGAHLSHRGPGDHFGEIALLRNVPRTATVTALTPLRLIAIERDRFLEAVTGHPQSRRTAEVVAAEQMEVGGLSG